jgi:hypothetical protein
MTVLDQAREYYDVNRTKLDQVLGAISFQDVNLKYPDSVVICFDHDNFSGEISVWNNVAGPYLECEVFKLSTEDVEPFYLYIDTSTSALREDLDRAVDGIKAHLNINYP